MAGTTPPGGRNTGNSLPNPDAVQEFRVITNNYGAEFGRFAGGMIDVVTKSGANNLHGSLFHFLRNDVLNATPWNVRDKPALRRNQFGGSFGGPIIKDRTFYFGSYSGLRQREVDIRSTAVVPTALERLGDFNFALYSARPGTWPPTAHSCNRPGCRRERQPLRLAADTRNEMYYPARIEKMGVRNYDGQTDDLA